MRRALLAVATVVLAAGAVAAASRTGSGGGVPTPLAAPTPTTLSVPPRPLTEAPDPGPPPAAPSMALSAALDAVWNDTPGGCLTVVGGAGILYEANGSAQVAPASVTKLFTAAAALDALGPSTRLRTSVVAAAAPVDGVVAGDLWLVGGGDPVLGTDAWGAQLSGQTPLYTSLDALADRVLAAGVRRVEGRVVGDESRYDADRFVDTWPTRLIADGEAGPLSALSVNDGFRVWGHPGVPFADPPTEAAALFTELLVARGIAVVGAPGRGTAPGEVVDIAVIESPPVGDLVHAMLRDSDNGTAELLVKELGLQWIDDGSTGAGVGAVYELLGDEVPLAGVVIADGSGLSDAARLTCRAVTALLTGRSADLADLLPVAGRDGTLAGRFVDTPVAGRLRAKTGSLDGIAALAGYADTTSGATVGFAYIVNGLADGETGRSLQDAVARALVSTAR